MWPCLMYNIHALCCDCAFPQLESSEAFEYQQRQGLLTQGTGAATVCPTTEVIMHKVSWQMPADSL